MKKLVPLVLVLVLLLVATSVVSADPPPGVGSAVRIDPFGACSVGYNDNGTYVPVYEGSVRLQYSNGATGHLTWKCKMDLLPGFAPIYLYWEQAGIPGANCYSTFSLEGEKGTWTGQCVGYWTAP